MLRADAFQFASCESIERFALRQPAGGSADRAGQTLSQDERFGFFAAGEFLRDVALFRVDGDREIRRQRPGRGRPDDKARFVFPRAGGDRELDVNRGVLPVLVFHLSLGQGGLRAGAPKNRLERFVDQTLFHEDGEGAQDLRLVGRVHRQVRIFPVAEDAEALELLALDVDELARKGFRALSHFERGKAARFLDDFVFDRQTVAVPAGNIRRPESGHRFRFHDQVLEDLVERGPHVDVAVGEGRAVMQDEKLGLGAGSLDLVVEPSFLPGAQDLGLAGRETGLHRKIRFRQVEGLLVILAHRGAPTLTFSLGKATHRRRSSASPKAGSIALTSCFLF